MVEERDFEGHQIQIPAPTRALIVNAEQAWLLNSRVRHNEVEPTFSDYGTRFSAKFEDEALRINPHPLALQIIRALRDLQSMTETSILVSEEECWFLERRFRHNDREPAARALLLKIHEIILAFHQEFTVVLPEVDLGLEVEADADRSYKDTDQNADEDAATEPDTGDGA